MDKDVCCTVCGYPHVKVRNDVKSIAIATVNTDGNFPNRMPIKYETSLYKDTEVCHLCWQEVQFKGRLNKNRLKRESAIKLAMGMPILDVLSQYEKSKQLS